MCIRSWLFNEDLPVNAMYRSIALVALASVLTAPLQAQEGEPPPDAQTAMQGGGMTGERQLDDERARQHFRIATQYYDEGRFQEAAAQFSEAYALSARGELLYNAYIAYREARDSIHAAAALESYLAQIPNAPDRANLQARLEELRRAIASDAQQAEALETARQEATEARARAEEEARARRDAEAAPEAWPWIIFGVGAAAVIAGSVTGGIALSEAGSLRAECDDNGLCPFPQSEIDERRSTPVLLSNVTDGLLIGGGVVAATGLILGLIFGLPSGGGEETASTEVNASCGPGGCGATVRGRF